MHFKAGFKNTGIDKEERDIQIRSLRNTYNTKMKDSFISANVDLEILREQIGHKSMKMTDRYDDPDIEKRLDSLAVIKPQVDNFFTILK